jgi:hypothetical protein
MSFVIISNIKTIEHVKSHIKNNVGLKKGRPSITKTNRSTIYRIAGYIEDRGKASQQKASWLPTKHPLLILECSSIDMQQVVIYTTRANP